MQINNAGDGGLYAEMVRDHSFEALAAKAESAAEIAKVNQAIKQAS